MEPLQVLREGVTGLSGHKLRAGLAVLGISIGVAAVIAMVALGEGAKARSKAEFDKLGADLILVTPQTPTKEGLHGEGDGQVRPLTVDDAARVFEMAGCFEDWSAEVRDTTALATRGKDSCDAEIHGVLPSFMRLRNFQAARGRLIEESDLAAASKVCVLGSEIAGDLFGPEEDPVGREVILDMAKEEGKGAPGAGGVRCQVVGVLEPKGQVMWINFDRYILMPMTTAQRHFRGDDAADMLLFKPAEGEDPDDAAFLANMLLARRHRETPDFVVRLQSESRQAKEETLRIFSWLISGIAGISLLVGGIGITNIMLISVLERTREIGVRMAIGARKRDILGQFLTEAVTIGILGGIGGLLLGPWLGKGIAQVLTSLAFQTGQPWVSRATWFSALVAMGFSFLVGVLSGIYPALKASRLDPVEALRYE